MAAVSMEYLQRKCVSSGLFVLVIGVAMMLGSTVTQPGGECESRFMQDLFRCFNDLQVPFNTYLWAVTNGTNNTPISAENETVFKEHMCSVEREVVACVLDSLHTHADSAYCRTADGMRTLLTVQVRAIFEEYDNYCAHDCRQSLETDMDQCYQDVGLDPFLFTSATTDGAILGRTITMVATFCQNRDAVVTCLKKRRDECPEASSVLRKHGLDLDTFSTGVKVLCRQPEVYLASLSCFGSQTRRVERCQEEHGLTLRRLVSDTQTATNISRQHLLHHFCMARVQFIKCDLESWAAKPSHACDVPALSLKRDLHCSQLPEVCTEELGGPVDKICTYNWATASLPVKNSPSSSTSTSSAVGFTHRHLDDTKFVLCGMVSVFLVSLAFQWIDVNE